MWALSVDMPDWIFAMAAISVEAIYVQRVTRDVTQSVENCECLRVEIGHGISRRRSAALLMPVADEPADHSWPAAGGNAGKVAVTLIPPPLIRDPQPAPELRPGGRRAGGGGWRQCR